jgi:large subunit ribosomal protein L22
MRIKYSIKEKQEGYAYAQEYSLNVSYKNLTQVCNNVRGLPVAKALDFLNKAEKKETAVLFSTYNKKIGHRKELGGKQGRYPVKAIGMVKKVLLNAINNARVLQMDEDTLTVAHIAANKQHVYSRLAPKGKRMRANYETAKLEIALKGDVKQIAEVSLPEKKKKKKEKVEETKPEGEVKPEVVEKEKEEPKVEKKEKEIKKPEEKAKPEKKEEKKVEKPEVKKETKKTEEKTSEKKGE